MDSKAFCIDCRNRKLETFVASVTQAQSDNPYQLVLRQALDTGKLKDLLDVVNVDDDGNKEARRAPKTFLSDMSVILLGEYTSKNSAGHVTIHSGKSWSEQRDGHREVTIVGGLGNAFSSKKGLRVFVNPITATLVRGPVEIEELTSAKNSNCYSANAVWAGVKMLARFDSRWVFLVEGQSDYKDVIRFRSSSITGITEFPFEYREKMFSRESVIRQIVFRSSYYELLKEGDGIKPAQAEVVARAKKKMEAYLLSHAINKEDPYENLTASFGVLNIIDNEVLIVAKELGVSTDVLNFVGSKEVVLDIDVLEDRSSNVN